VAQGAHSGDAAAPGCPLSPAVRGPAPNIRVVGKGGMDVEMWQCGTAWADSFDVKLAGVWGSSGSLKTLMGKAGTALLQDSPKMGEDSRWACLHG